VISVGCVVKPAEDACLSLLRVAELAVARQQVEGRIQDRISV